GITTFNSRYSIRGVWCEHDSSAPSRRVLRSSVSKMFYISSGKPSVAAVWLPEVKTMGKSLQEHIENLEKTLQVLTARLMDEEPGKLKARGELQSHLRAVESALRLYRSALEIEECLSKSQRPLPQTGERIALGRAQSTIYLDRVTETKSSV